MPPRKAAVATPAEPKAPKRGRPFKEEGTVRDIRILLRVNPAEQAALEAGAKRAKQDLSPWIRDLCLAAAEASKRPRK